MKYFLYLCSGFQKTHIILKITIFVKKKNENIGFNNKKRFVSFN